MFKTIFTYEDTVDCSSDFICFGGVTFLQDFGIFKKGQDCEELNVDYDSSTLQEQDNDGNNIGEPQKFNLTPVA